MKTYKLTLSFVFFVTTLLAQGPPITSDKPIMLGGKSITIKSLTEFRNTQRGSSVYIPLMFHYLLTSNSLIALHLPMFYYDFKQGMSGANLADIQIVGKYQFYKKDQTGKTFRMAAKTLQNLPTGKKIDLIGQSIKEYQAYYGLVVGYETLKYGISSEIGHNWSPSVNLDEFRTKLGIGLPLLKPKYPNKQINLYFEYTSSWFFERSWYQLLYAQGVQYALKNITFDASLQFPLVNKVTEGRRLKQSIFLGTRYTF